jgi:hypothetical protein
LDQKTKEIVERLRGPKAVWDGDLQIAASLIESLSERVGKLERMLGLVSNERDIAAQLAIDAGHDPDDLISIYDEGEPAPPLAKASSWFLPEARALLSKHEERG